MGSSKETGVQADTGPAVRQPQPKKPHAGSDKKPGKKWPTQIYPKAESSANRTQQRIQSQWLEKERRLETDSAEAGRMARQLRAPDALATSLLPRNKLRQLITSYDQKI